ncbi:LysR family transcriptional regulator [Kibdelosporangium phytohabitans]|uniref:LysR family transcriptional regulator n=1 Tax=Kibdelosporangium phytohabitans TaxID=860235 RepID=A0A0N9HU77_9PSEU|nr:LysR family transcriptional regulator [Kibdelosporangium phytohabitans]ALG08547.1 LysR family transcriptional regulator [Kibdelosporangium phytohabitans]MBE1470377.1 DNA-binding transcriptional LysR family regulator [Kibdelosporangium phytohabitans]
MDLLQLRYFQAVARREHISQAAEELRVAQPSVSRTIARLEKELGVPLFDRQGRQVRLNSFGTAFLRRVDRALGELDEARRELADAAGLEHGRVVVAAETLLTVTPLVARLRAEYPGVDVRLFQSNADTMVRQLGDREVDLCFASQPLTGPLLRSAELLREKVLLAVPATHPFAAGDRVGVADLAGEPFVTSRAGYWPRALLERIFAGTGSRPVIACECDELGTSADLISAGLGVGLVPEMSRGAPTPTQGPVVWVELDAPGCERVLSLVWRADTYLPAAAQKLRELAHVMLSRL